MQNAYSYLEHDLKLETDRAENIKEDITLYCQDSYYNNLKTLMLSSMKNMEVTEGIIEAIEKDYRKELVQFKINGADIGFDYNFLFKKGGRQETSEERSKFYFTRDEISFLHEKYKQKYENQKSTEEICGYDISDFLDFDDKELNLLVKELYLKKVIREIGYKMAENLNKTYDETDEKGKIETDEKGKISNLKSQFQHIGTQACPCGRCGQKTSHEAHFFDNNKHLFANTSKKAVMEFLVMKEQLFCHVGKKMPLNQYDKDKQKRKWEKSFGKIVEDLEKEEKKLKTISLK